MLKFYLILFGISRFFPTRKWEYYERIFPFNHIFVGISSKTQEKKKKNTFSNPLPFLE